MSSLSPQQSTVSRLLACFFLCSPLASVTATLVLYGHSSLPQDILKLSPNQVCPRLTDGLTSTSFPWTHSPTCVEASVPMGHPLGYGAKETYCVYTNSRFANGRGISIITTPEVATSYVAESYSHEDQEDRGQEIYVMRESSAHGIGTFAKESVKAGDTVMAKHPVLLITRGMLHGGAREERHRLLELAVQQLPEKTTQSLLMLAKSRGGHDLDDIMQTNAIGMRLLNGAAHLGLVPEVARVNHDCRPNTYYRLNDYTLTLDLFALRDIKPGEELTYSYGFSDHVHEHRLAALRENWGFECKCSLCTSSPPVLSKSDERLQEISSIREVLPTGFDAVPKFIALLPNLIKLLDEEGLVREKPMYEEILAYSWSTLGIEDKAKLWAGRARRGWEIIAGKDSWEAKRTGELESNPKEHGTWATWDKDPWDDSVWEDDHHGEDEHDHEHEH